MSKKLIIKDADFSENALAVIMDGDVTLSLRTSAISGGQCQRCGCQASIYSGHFAIFRTSTSSGTWHTYIADVSSFVGKTVQVKYSNGYSANVTANGAFLNESAPAFQDGWTPVVQTDYSSYAIQTICQVASEESNVELTKTYTIPSGAKWLMWSSKTQGEAIVLAE